MSHKNSTTPMEYLEELFSYDLLQLAPPQTEKPEYEALVFFQKIPPELLQRRKEAVADQAGFEEWFLVTEKLGGAEWLGEMRGEYVIGVVAVPDINAAYKHLASLMFSARNSENSATNRDTEPFSLENYHSSK